MISEKDPVSVVSKKNKTKRKFKKRTFIIGLVFLFTFTTYVANAVHVKQTYNNMKLSFTSVKEIEYGTANYNPMDLVKKVKDGKIKKYTKKIDTTKLGMDLLAVQGTLKSLLQHHSSKASILCCSAFFIGQLSHPCMTTGKTIALTRQTFVG